MRAQHIHSSEEQGAVGDWKQQLIQWPVDTPWRIVFRGSADSPAQHCALALQTSGAVAVTVTFAPVSVCEPVGKDPVHPAFQNGWHREPPQRKLHYQSICREQLALLRLNVGCLLSCGIGMTGFSDKAQPLAVGANRKVIRVKHGLP